MSFKGFTDLRLNGGAGGNVDESFWPSFADIMTVIVMIFLMAMVILLIRNWELVKQLEESVKARELAVIAQEREALEKATIAGRLESTEGQVAMLQLELYRLQADSDAKADELKQKQAKLDAVNAEVEGLQMSQRALSSRVNELEAMNATLYTDVTRAQQAEAEMRANLAAAQESLQSQESEYDTLKKKYDRLIKPARTAKGKEVVEVRYHDDAGPNAVAVKTSRDQTYQFMSAVMMHETLSKLKAEYPDRLYIKIIFPEGSEISHSDAWRFTSTLLERYDYYYNASSGSP